MREPTGLAFAGDWHMNYRWGITAIDAVARQGADTILHLGDYGYTYEQIFIDSIEDACATNDVMLYFIDGNHDLHELLWALPLDEDGFGILSEHVRYIPRGHRWSWWGVSFMGVGGATSVDKPHRKPFVEWWPTEAVSAADVYTATMLGHVDVMVAHDAPTRVAIPGISLEEGLRYFGREELEVAECHRETMRGIVEAVTPKLYVHGHYHVFYHYSSVEDNCTYVGLSLDGTSVEENLWLVRTPFDLVGIE